MESSETKKRARAFINHPVTEFVILGLIFVSVLVVLLEFSMHEGEPYFGVVERINDVFTWLFVMELGVRYWVERRKRRFFKKYWVDILAVVPFFRSFRILRVFRLLRLFRFGIIASRRLNRLTGGVSTVKTEYVLIGLSILVVVLMGAFSMRYVEGPTNQGFETLEQALWFSVMTVIGGEPIGGYPKTSLGMLVTVVLMMGGLTVFAIFTGTISAVMINSLKNIQFRTMELDELENHVVVCGWNRAGQLLVEELLHENNHLGRRFRHIVIVTEEEAVTALPFFRQHAEHLYVVNGDYTRLSVLRDAGVDRASFAMLLADEAKEDRTAQDRDARTVLAAMLIEKLNRDIYTVVQLLNRDNETSLRQVGVEEIIVSDEYVGNIMATVAKNRGIVSMLDELLTAKHGHQFFKSSVPAAMVGLTVAQAMTVLKQDHDATLLAVDVQEGTSVNERVHVNPRADLVLEAGHQIIVAGSKPIK